MKREGRARFVVFPVLLIAAVLPAVVARADEEFVATGRVAAPSPLPGWNNPTVTESMGKCDPNSPFQGSDAFVIPLPADAPGRLARLVPEEPDDDLAMEFLKDGCRFVTFSRVDVGDIGQPEESLVPANARFVMVELSVGADAPFTFSLTVVPAGGATAPPAGALKATCGPGSDPETGIQGRVSRDDVDSGRAERGYRCNTEQVSRFGVPFPGNAGGYRVHRYRDEAGHECAYYDSSLLAPTGVLNASPNATGVYVLDMTDPAHPVKTMNLLTPAMQSPHESLSLNQRRGLLAAAMGSPLFNAGVVDIYDLRSDCRFPRLRSSTPLGVIGHEATFAPDGLTFYVSSSVAGTAIAAGPAFASPTHPLLTAIDVSNPDAPSIVFVTSKITPHGMNVSDDGNRLYVADVSFTGPGMRILDVSEVQARLPHPTIRQISYLNWSPVLSPPQVPLAVTIGGHPYLVEVDEFGGMGNPNSPVGAARIIDIADERHPHAVSNLRLEVNEPANIAATADDPGARGGYIQQTYGAHYCAVPQREDPGIVACTFILSGLRVFDIRDPLAPKELAYFNGPIARTDAAGQPGSSFAMSAPAFAPERSEIWYSDGNTGFFAVRISNDLWPVAPAPGP